MINIETWNCGFTALDLVGIIRVLSVFLAFSFRLDIYQWSFSLNIQMSPSLQTHSDLIMTLLIFILFRQTRFHKKTIQSVFKKYWDQSSIYQDRNEQWVKCFLQNRPFVIQKKNYSNDFFYESKHLRKFSFDME